jgi:hypothetical protein
VNFLALVQRLKTECGVSGSTPTSVVSQTGEYGRLVNWINTAWMDIQMMRQDWDWMRTTATFPTVTGQATYTTTQIGLTDFGKWARDTFRNYANPSVTFSIASPCVMTLTSHNLSVGDTVIPFTTGALPTGLTSGTTYYVQSVPSSDTVTLSATSGGTAINTSGTQSGTHTISSNNVTTFAGLKSEIFMPYIEYDFWRDGYEFGALRQTQTRPTVITITPNKSIGLGPFPISGYTVLGDYYRVPTEMSVNTDTPTLPTQYHMAIVYRAMMSYGAFEAASEVYQRGEMEFNKMIRRVLADRLPEITAGSALS